MGISKIAVLLAAGVMMSGCISTPPVIMEHSFQRKVITPCDNDIFCFRNTYSVTWDSYCRTGSFNDVTGCSYYVGSMPTPNYPVSYRSSEYIVETGSDGYMITLPAGGAVKMFNDPK